MNITYCWTEPSGYLSACIDELASRPGVQVSLLTWETAAEAPFELPRVAAGRHHLMSRQTRDDYVQVKRLVLDTKPDVVFIVGWAHGPYVRLVFDPDLDGVQFVMGADTPIRFDWRQWLAPLRIGRLLQKIDAVCVPGERGFQVMRYWNVPGRKISKLLYGVDYEHFARDASARRLAGYQWPKRFLYVGRYVAEKGIDVLVEAYQGYRRSVDEPWPLTVCGKGPEAVLVSGVNGIEDRGFIQPAQLDRVFAEAGVFVLPSRMDPWGQVIVEAAAAALPIICTQACGASAELVRDYHSGLVVPPADAAALRDAFIWMHHHYDRLSGMGFAGQQLAAAYSAQRWADNQLELATRIVCSEVTAQASVEG